MVRAVAAIVANPPAAERIADTSFILGQSISGELARDYVVPYQNLNQWYRSTHNSRLKNGTVFNDGTPASLGFLNLALWTLGGFIASYALLARKETG